VKPAHLVCFRIGKETFGVDIFSVREIVRVQEITKVPGAPEFVMGVINLRGRIISVVDLGLQLGQPPTQVGRNSRILVIQLDGVTLGFLVDAATAVMKVAGEAIEPPPEMMGDIKAEYLDGVAKLEGRLAMLLNLKKVLTAPQAVAAAEVPTAEPVGAEGN
jgi:purine-binding chemotaxis protein CheW